MRILLVENNQEWQDSVRRGLPEYQVDVAPSYDEALAFLHSGRKYALSIVDLHLNDSETNNPLDELGGDVLEYLRENHPLTRRIALTGSPPGAVRQIFELYDLDELLLKQRLTIADLRKAVRVALGRAGADIPSDVKAQISELRADFDKWRIGWIQWHEQQSRELKDHIRIAALLAESKPETGQSLAALESRKQDFDNECADVDMMLGDIAESDDISRASREINRLKQKFDPIAGAAETSQLASTGTRGN
jgi:CheY-like chemotaxis protein